MCEVCDHVMEHHSLLAEYKGFGTLYFQSRYCFPQDGIAPLGWAAFKGRVECVKLLLERGADPNHQDNVSPNLMSDQLVFSYWIAVLVHRTTVSTSSDTTCCHYFAQILLNDYCVLCYIQIQ